MTVQIGFWPAIITGGSAIIVALITGSITLRMTLVNNKRQDDRWRADFFLKMKFEALADFRQKSAIAMKSMEYFCSEKGNFELLKTLNLKEKDPYHQPPKRDYTTVYVTEESKQKFIKLTNEKARILEGDFLELDKSYKVITIYLTKEEKEISEKFIEEMRRYEHFISGNIKNYGNGEDIHLLENFIHYSATVYKEGYQKLRVYENEADNVLIKHLFPEKVRRLVN
ncbi:hypothetical protein COE65_14435 [Bacillus sp. AFS051223]|uniref:hypothetical protein n=1 Tax=Bacillus sp. AFS051223 TaxID=2034280 RepID=UPI000BFC3F48|nr:hypothetical protein [Bacillus sp. AFS051223]PHA10385.1 hypothetical protein COE65_14435 [Bacillus sp. AFS051223]